jgi:bacterial leucyl aminopeptidase
MKVYLLLVLVLAVIAQEKHLIKVSQNDQGKWVTEEEINRFTVGTETNFMDVTYTSDLEKGTVPESSKVISDLRLKSIVHPMIAQVKEANLNKTILHLSSYFNRFYTTQDGEDAAKWIRKQYEDIIDGLSGDRKARLSVELFEHRWKQPSVIVRFRGKSSSVRDQIVVLGSHLDSTAGGASRRSPGADDDATGSSSVMEAFRVMIQDNSWDPDRTVEWHHYAAEEVGLLGSQAVVQRYKQDQKKIHGMLQSLSQFYFKII